MSAVARQVHADGMGATALSVMEFGVYSGRSIRVLTRLFPRAHLCGFDTFSGFLADGRTDWQLDFSVARLPAVPASVELVVGPF